MSYSGFQVSESSSYHLALSMMVNDILSTHTMAALSLVAGVNFHLQISENVSSDSLNFIPYH